MNNSYDFCFCKVGFGKNANEAPAFGQVESTAKSKVIKLIGAVQTLLRSMYHLEKLL